MNVATVWEVVSVASVVSVVGSIVVVTRIGERDNVSIMFFLKIFAKTVENLTIFI